MSRYRKVKVVKPISLVEYEEEDPILSDSVAIDGE
jgi:hypothetical protein